MTTAVAGSTCRTSLALRKRLIPPILSRLTPTPTAASSSSSSSQWRARQQRDQYAREAKVQGLRSRAAWKLNEMNEKYRLFRRGQTVVDLGYAPGSWSQVAKAATGPDGIVVGIDLIPALPPRGVTSIQGNMLNPSVRNLVREVLLEQTSRRDRDGKAPQGPDTAADKEAVEEDVIIDQPSYIDQERQATQDIVDATGVPKKDRWMVDVVLSDMSEPWPQSNGFSSRTLSNPYRLASTSGIQFKDHIDSMNLCYAALEFASTTLKAGGHFVCKFYQGSDDDDLQRLLHKMFATVHRDKPASSRSESKEAYFVALQRKGDERL